MFSLFHFSPVFPYIHPYLFPVQEPTGTAAASPGATSSPAALPAAKCTPETEAAAGCSSSRQEVQDIGGVLNQGRRLKGLYRRHLRSHRNETLTYSGALRPA